MPPAHGRIRKVESFIPSSQGFVLYLDCGHRRIAELVPSTRLARCLECAAAAGASVEDLLGEDGPRAS